MKKRIYALFVAMLIAGCAFTDRIGQTSFEPIESNGQVKTFKYVARSTGYTPANSESAEQLRMKWLDEWIADNHYCQAGYRITSRREVDLGVSDAVKNIYYVGVCK